jgi:hypothetical protein
MLASGRTQWERGDQVRVYRARGGQAALLHTTEDGEPSDDTRDYDATHYIRLLRETFAARLARAFTADDFATLFGDPLQPSLFATPIETIHPVLTSRMAAPEVDG